VAPGNDDRLAHKPPGQSFEHAATLPVSGVTALQAVHDHARVHEGQRVLVTGASGGVGSFTVQLLKAAGAHVTGVCSNAKAQLVRSSARMTSSTTPTRTSPTAATATTSSSTLR
jgi:NADPH:quinone reductase-like Zn-dependent oxidoreductase